MTKQLTFFRLLFYGSLVLVSFLILSVFCTLDETSYSWFFSSDALYLPSIYKDLFIDGYPLDGWHFNPAPNFFPDMIVYFILMYITGSFLLSTAFFAIVQYVAIIILFRSIIKQIFDNKTSNNVAAFSNLLLALYLVKFIINDISNLSFPLLINSYHTSVFTLSLLGYLLFIKYIKKGNWIYLVVSFFIILLGVLSDKLLLVAFSSPIVVMSFFFFKYPIKRSRVFIFAGITVAASISALILFNNIRSIIPIHIDLAHRMFSYEFIFVSAQKFLGDTLYMLRQFDFNSLAFLLSILSIIVGITFSISHVLQKQKFTNWSTYILFSTLFSVFIIIAPIINGSFTDVDCFRYNMYAFYLGALNIPLFLIKFKSFYKWISFAGIPILAGYYLILIGLNFSQTNYKSYYTYYPDSVKSIDEIAQKEGLLKGVGNYWDAKFTTMFSRQNVRVYSVHDVLTKYYHVMNENWYNSDSVVFNFVVDNKIDQTNLKEFFQMDTITYVLDFPKIIKVPEFKYTNSSWEPQLLDSSIE